VPGVRRGKTLVHNSNFRPLKRVEDTVRVLAKVRERVPDATLVLIGDGPTRTGVEALARELGVIESTRFLGEQSDVVPALQAASVFLFPSETESFGLAALEALSCAVPVIASRTGGLPELIDDGKTGFLATVGDVTAMADAAVRLLTDPTLSTRMSVAARQAAESRWQIDPRVDPYEALYRRLL
jgi:N-acetyl-alpha-D-glucosaminyl L-malate synthase BshA